MPGRRGRVPLHDRRRLIEAYENEEDFVTLANTLGIIVL